MQTGKTMKKFAFIFKRLKAIVPLHTGSPIILARSANIIDLARKMGHPVHGFAMANVCCTRI